MSPLADAFYERSMALVAAAREKNAPVLRALEQVVLKARDPAAGSEHFELAAAGSN